MTLVAQAKPVPTAGLGVWQTVTLDQAIGSGVIDAADLDGLGTRELARLARLLVRAQHGHTDARALVAQARNA